jgi:hypothetical protein
MTFLSEEKNLPSNQRRSTVYNFPIRGEESSLQSEEKYLTFLSEEKNLPSNQRTRRIKNSPITEGAPTFLNRNKILVQRIYKYFYFSF